MGRLEIYDRVNQCTSFEDLAKVIRDLADEDGMIQGRTRKFDANKMADACLRFKEYMASGWPNILTREYGIRQQAMYLDFYIPDKKSL